MHINRGNEMMRRDEREDNGRERNGRKRKGREGTA